MRWVETVEQINREHNGVFSVELFYGHDGHHSCVFKSYTETLAKGESGRSMQDAVDRCVEAWKLETSARWAAKNPEDLKIARSDDPDGDHASEVTAG
jgi:hypothetical protein